MVLLLTFHVDLVLQILPKNFSHVVVSLKHVFRNTVKNYTYIQMLLNMNNTIYYFYFNTMTRLFADLQTFSFLYVFIFIY
jgi:hypothetical protein